MKLTPYTPDEIVQLLRALENICRFNGHVKRFYSVAEHTSVGLWYMEKLGQSRNSMRAFFVHDLPEAVLGIGDITRDVKRRPEIAKIVAPLEREAFERINGTLPFDTDTYGAVVKAYDRVMAVAEVECIAKGIQHDDPRDYDLDYHGIVRARIDSISTGWARYRPLINWANDLWPGVLV